MTSVHACILSVLENKDAFGVVLRKRLINKQQVADIIIDPEFWTSLKTLEALLAPLSNVIMGVQANTTMVADITRYWAYLACWRTWAIHLLVRLIV